MLFFPKRKDGIKKQIKSVSLQVRKSPVKFVFGKKRVFLFIPLSASVTVEAALVLSLFLFFLAALMTPFVMLHQQRKVQANLEMVSEVLSLYANTEEGEEQSEGVQWLTKEGITLFLESRLDKKQITDLSLSQSEILEDGETIDLIANFKVKLPISVFGIKSVPVVARSYRRGFVGINGRLLQSESQSEIVYVGKNSTRYHKERTCHYIYHTFLSIPYETISSYRNESGGKYENCSRCNKGDEARGMVYITKNGSHYHSNKGCSAMLVYVKAVERSSVMHLGPCSSCSK